MFVLAATSAGMPRKIGFTVVDSSSHEENFSASELMYHAPTVSGWRSSRYIYMRISIFFIPKLRRCINNLKET